MGIRKGKLEGRLGTGKKKRIQINPGGADSYKNRKQSSSEVTASYGLVMNKPAKPKED